MLHYSFSWFAVPPFFTALCSLVVGHWVLYREKPSRLGERVLSKAGYQVKTASSAQEAEAMLQRFPDLTVIFVSGHTRNAVVHNSRVDDEVAFLEKPFNPEMLLRKVREAVPLPTRDT